MSPAAQAHTEACAFRRYAAQLALGRTASAPTNPPATLDS